MLGVAKAYVSRRGALIVGIGLVAILFGALVGAVAGYLRSAPTLREVTFKPELTTYLYDIHGKVIARLYRENRVYVPLSQIPLHLQHAVLAAEDASFYEHHGVDFRGILRAFFSIVRGGALQGGSTITQQLARNAFLTLEQTWSRKLKELLWTIQIERKYSKDEILEAYLNEIYLWQGAYGVEAGAQVYFGKHVSELTLAESALIAAVLNGPGYYSPYVDMAAAQKRRNWVLDRMHAVGYIDAGQAAAAKAQPVVVVGLANEIQAPYFVDYVTQQLVARYGENTVFTGGLKVYTTLDLAWQKQAEKALIDGLTTSGIPPRKDQNGLLQPQGAVLTLDATSGEIRAMVGGRGDDKYNRAVQAVRQPGSAMKPFVYLAALEHGYTPASIVVDEPVSYTIGAAGTPWSPQNYEKTFQGAMTVREALEHSTNVVAVKVLDAIGVQTTIEYIKKLGITTLVQRGAANDVNLSLALGGLTRGVKPIEMAVAYAAFANQGIRVQPIAIRRVEDSSGNLVDEFQAKKDVVLKEATAYVLTDMLRGVVERGSGRRANIGRPVAGKTGTTDDFSNAWFVGYTPDVVTVVYIGNDNQAEPMIYPNIRVGSALASEIWGNYMRAALAGTPIHNFPKPAGVVDEVPVDIKTGGLVPDTCLLPRDEVRAEVFIVGTAPDEPSERCSPSFSSRLPPTG